MRYYNCKECREFICPHLGLGEDSRKVFCLFIVNPIVERAVEKIIDNIIANRKRNSIDITQSHLESFLHVSRN